MCTDAKNEWCGLCCHFMKLKHIILQHNHARVCTASVCTCNYQSCLPLYVHHGQQLNYVRVQVNDNVLWVCAHRHQY